MTKSLLIVSLSLMAFGLSAFSFFSFNKKSETKEAISCGIWMNSIEEISFPDVEKAATEFIINVDSRFVNKITRGNLLKAKSIVDIIPKEGIKNLVSYQNVRVGIVQPERDNIVNGENALLNPAQLELFQAADYTTDFFIKADCKSMSFEDYELVYYMSVVPETPATFIEGPQALLDYLRKNSENETRTFKNSVIQPGYLYFTVTKTGLVENIKLPHSCGHVSVDQKMKELILSLSGKWHPARNSKGEKVDEELVLNFGAQGC